MELDVIKRSVYQNHLYDPLWVNEHLGDNLIFLGIGGSYAYETNIETSDIDIH